MLSKFKKRSNIGILQWQFIIIFLLGMYGGGSADVLWGKNVKMGKEEKGVNVIERLWKNDTDPYESGSATLEVINRHFARRGKGSEE
jgi:hypothetical protein